MTAPTVHGAGRGRVFALDLDGTLLSCEPRQVALAARLHARFAGAELDAQAFWAAKRAGAPTLEALTATGCNASVAEAVAAEWIRQIEHEEWLAHDTLLPGGIEAAAAIVAHGMQPVVVTARRDPEATLAQLAWLGLSDALATCVVVAPGEHVERRKAAALRRLRALAFVGDTETDAAAAAEAGVPFAAVCCGQRSREYLESRVGGTVFDTARQAVEALLASAYLGE